MCRWTTLVLAGALGWPAVSFAQEPMPATASGPADSSPGKATVQRPSLDRPTPEGFLPVVPPLPPTATMVQAAPIGAALNQDLPKPTEVAPPPGPAPAPNANLPKPVVPDVSGLPAPDKCMMCAGFPPSTCAPLIPAPCPPPAPEPDCCPDAGGLLWFGDILFLRANRRDPSAILQLNTGFVSANDLVGYEGDHDLAYQVGGGWLTEGSWIFTAAYMQYKDPVSSQIFVNNDPNGNFNVTYIGPGQLLNTTLGQPGFLVTSWNLQFRTIDVFCGGCYSPTHYLDLVAGGGIRLAWIDQDFRTTIDATASEGVIQGENLNMTTRGAGPRIGGEARAYIYPWLNLYGRSFGSLLLAHRNDDSLKLESNADGTINALTTVVYSREEIIPTLELAAGAEATLLCGRLQLGAGYEFNYVWQASTSSTDTLSTPRIITHNDLSLDGFYARITWLW